MHTAPGKNGPGATRSKLIGHLLWMTALAVGAGVIIYMIATRDLRQIHGRLSRIARLVSKQQDESALTGLMRAREIMTCFSSNVVVDLGSPWQKVVESGELTAVIHHTRSSSQSIDVTVRDRTTTLERARGMAVTVATVEASFGYRGSTDRDVRVFRIFWIKNQAGWVIERVEAADSIQPPPGLRAWEP